MRFLTFEWWAGFGEEPDAAIEDYWRHFDGIRQRLPPAVVAFAHKHTLHDARVQRMTLTTAQSLLELEALGHALALDEGRRYSLRYVGVAKFEVLGARDLPLGGPGGLGDLGYDEWELLPSGRLEHRLLFSTGVEVVVEFVEFGYDAAPYTWPDVSVPVVDSPSGS